MTELTIIVESISHDSGEVWGRIHMGEDLLTTSAPDIKGLEANFKEQLESFYEMDPEQVTFLIEFDKAPETGGWNHRVVTGLSKNSAHPERYFMICEVYYKDGIPDMYTQEGKRVVSSIFTDDETSEKGIADLTWQLDKMKECLDKPMLDADNWPNEYVNETDTAGNTAAEGQR